MTPQEFSSPEYTETHWCLFDTSTGAILATETVWTDEGAEPYDQGPSPTLLREFAAHAGGEEGNVDAIQVDHRPVEDERVDVTRRVLVGIPTAGDAGPFSPLRLERP